MYSALKIFDYRQKSEKGFVLIAALMAMMIILAVSIFILNTTTKDVFISSRLVGERKAFSAAESGMQYFCLNFTGSAMSAVSNQSVDATNDSTAKFDIASPLYIDSIPAAGSSSDWVYLIWTADVTGKDTAYNSSATVTAGIKYGPTAGGGTSYE